LNERRRNVGIILPELVMAMVRQRVEAGGYSSPEEYLASLVAADAVDEAAGASLTAEERRHIGDLVLDQLDSGRAGVVANAAYWEDVRQRARERAEGQTPDVS
jgi:Arc/MetJ-type ribon-helix-helix transcriptional regulator